MAKYIVRYGTMRNLGVMAARVGEYRRGQEVVIRTDRGVEVGQVLCESTQDALSHLDKPPVGTIVRLLNDEDASTVNRIEEHRVTEIDRCQDLAGSLKLPLKLVEVERLLGGQRMIVYYVSDQRVDFRELVKLLAAEFQTRIEMKQIGVRDEAKILADYGDCGKPVCCNNHLVKMPPVSMRMAKLQKATLDPTKISGRCGRLKCCLRYEFDTYDELHRQLPSVGANIVTREGKARVIAQQILAQQLLVETEDHRRLLIEASEVLSVIRRGDHARATSKDSSEDAPSNAGPGVPRGSGRDRKKKWRGRSAAQGAADAKSLSETPDTGKQSIKKINTENPNGRLASGDEQNLDQIKQDGPKPGRRKRCGR